MDQSQGSRTSPDVQDISLTVLRHLASNPVNRIHKPAGNSPQVALRNQAQEARTVPHNPALVQRTRICTATRPPVFIRELANNRIPAFSKEAPDSNRVRVLMTTMTSTMTTTSTANHAVARSLQPWCRLF